MLKVAVGVGAFALTAALTVATGGTAMLVAGTAIGALQGGINSYLDQRNSGFKTDWATVGKEAFKGGVISGIAGGIGGAAAKTLTPLNFCGKTATEKFVQVAEHWVVGTVSDGATGMLATYVSERIDGKSMQEAMATTSDRMGQIWGNAALTSTVGTVFDAATAPKCFVAGTMITTATGLVAIENIEPGDMVLSENPETGEIEYKTVLTTFVSETDEITHVTIRNESDIQEIIDATPQHPFYVEGMGWVEASSLHAGMTIWFANGTKGIVEDISNEGFEEPVTVYNFEVKDFHTYFVGESGVLVHNACFRDKVIQLSGVEGDELDAHHVLPQKFGDAFAAAGIDNQNPIYGSMVPSSLHRSFSYDYNADWQSYLYDESGALIQRSAEDILDFAKMMSEKYDFDVLF